MGYNNYTREDLITMDKRNQWIIGKVTETLEAIQDIFNMSFGDIDDAIEAEDNG